MLPTEFTSQNSWQPNGTNYLAGVSHPSNYPNMSSLSAPVNAFSRRANHTSQRPFWNPNGFTPPQLLTPNFSGSRYQQPHPPFPQMPPAANSRGFAPRFNRPSFSVADQSPLTNRPPCRNCNSWHLPRSCPAFGIHCGVCSKPHHISRCCRSRFNAPP